MQLDRIDIALRPRTAWEAADLGFALVRRHAGVIARSWFLFGLPLFALLNALAWSLGKMWIASLALWWLKPWFDQLVLHILSHAVFTAPPSARATLRQQFRLRALLPWLLWRRIDLTRGLSLPVALLEGLRGRERNQRAALLGRASTSPVAIGLCLLMLHIEVAITLSVFALALMFVPFNFLDESAQVMFEVLLEDPPRWAQLLTNFVGFLAMSVVEPLFVGAGFALYLNRRTQLEAWDIELAFRRIARRLGALTLALLLVLPLATLPPPAMAAADADSTAVEAEAAAEADEPEADEAEEDDADDAEWVAEVVESRVLRDVFGPEPSDPDLARDIKQTLDAPEFGAKQTLSRWERIVKDTDRPESGDAAWLKWLSRAFGFLAEFGLWILLALLVVVVIVHASTWRLPLLERLRTQRRVAAAEVDPDHEPEPLPPDLPAAASALFARGAVREAMALLYRGACAATPQRVGRALLPGATESEVLRLARDIDDQRCASAIVEIVRQWQRAAYAADLPDAARFEALLARYADAGLAAP